MLLKCVKVFLQTLLAIQVLSCGLCGGAMAEEIEDRSTDELTCFEAGACTQSYHVGGDLKADKTECLEFCKSKKEQNNRTLPLLLLSCSINTSSHTHVTHFLW